MSAYHLSTVSWKSARNIDTDHLLSLVAVMIPDDPGQ